MRDTIRLTEAAAMLRVPYQTAHRLVLTGVLRGVLREGRWVVDAEDAARLVKAERRHETGEGRGMSILNGEYGPDGHAS